MSLADAPIETSCRITRPGSCADSTAKYAVVGVSTGRQVRVLARYPLSKPRYVEVELDGARLVTLPIDFAQDVSVEALCAGGVS